jgi:rhodanese-related sulfurtransferase
VEALFSDVRIEMSFAANRSDECWSCARRIDAGNKGIKSYNRARALGMREVFMTKWIVVAMIVFGMALAAPMVSAQDDQAPMDPTMMEAPPPTFIKPAEVLKMMQNHDTSFALVDTQPEMAYAQSHIPGAINYPFQERLTPPIPLPRDKTLILYCPCTHDEDSISMAKKLAEFGYYNVKILEGGWYKWEDLKYPVTGKPDAADDSSSSNAAPAAAAPALRRATTMARSLPAVQSAPLLLLSA